MVRLCCNTAPFLCDGPKTRLNVWDETAEHLYTNLLKTTSVKKKHVSLHLTCLKCRLGRIYFSSWL